MPPASRSRTILQPGRDRLFQARTEQRLERTDDWPPGTLAPPCPLLAVGHSIVIFRHLGILDEPCALFDITKLRIPLVPAKRGVVVSSYCMNWTAEELAESVYEQGAHG
jgi:hypothetical protein